MRFVSKSSNLQIVLRPGIPSNPIGGQLGVPGKYVKFRDGIVDVTEPDMIEMMLRHPGYNTDYICAETEDPWKRTRQSMEPGHVLTEIQYGHIGKSVATPKKMNLSPEIERMITEQAMNIAKAMLEKIAEKAESPAFGPETAESLKKTVVPEPIVMQEDEGEGSEGSGGLEEALGTSAPAPEPKKPAKRKKA